MSDNYGLPRKPSGNAAKRNLEHLSRASAIDGSEAVLLIDESCGAEALHNNGMYRLLAVNQLLTSLATLPLYGWDDINPQDISNLTQAASILATDAQDLLTASRSAAKRGDD